MAPGSLRLLAAQVVSRVCEKGQSLSGQVEQCSQQHNLSVLDRRLLAELATGSLRWSGRFDAILVQLLTRPLRKHDQDLHSLLKVGLYQLHYTRIPSHAAVNETVAACRLLGKAWASKMVNAVLRNAQRQADKRDAGLGAHEQFSYPLWLYNRINKHWKARLK